MQMLNTEHYIWLTWSNWCAEQKKQGWVSSGGKEKGRRHYLILSMIKFSNRLCSSACFSETRSLSEVRKEHWFHFYVSLLSYVAYHSGDVMVGFMHGHQSPEHCYGSPLLFEPKLINARVWLYIFFNQTRPEDLGLSRSSVSFMVF